MLTRAERNTRSRVLADRANKCVGCGHAATQKCPECNNPTCRRSVGLCGHAEGICAACVADRLRGL